MDKLRNEGLMETIGHELEDLKSYQKAIMQKLAKNEGSNIRLDDKRPESMLPDLEQRIADNLFAITNALEDFVGQKNEQAAKDKVVDLMQAS